MTSFGYGFSLGLRQQAGGAAAPTPTPTLPQPGAMVLSMGPEQMGTQADNTAFTSPWASSIGTAVAQQPTAASAPAYRAAALNGLPALEVTAAGTKSLPFTTLAGFQNVLNATDLTVMLVVRNQSSTNTLATALGPTGGAPGDFALQATNNRVCLGAATTATSTSGQSMPHPPGFTVIIYTYGNGAAALGPPFGQGNRLYVNGTCHNNQSTNKFTSSTATGWQFFAGRTGTAAQSFVGQVLGCYAWNTCLGLADVLRATKWACDKWAQPYPWASASEFVIFSGDSQTSNTSGGVAENGWAYQTLNELGRVANGTWSLISRPSANITAMRSRVGVDIAGVSAVTGKPVKIVAGEWYNQTPSNAESEARGFIADVKAVDPTAKICWWTSIDSFQTPDTARATYNAAWDANNAALDVYAPIHTDPTIGVEGSCPAGTSASTYWADGVHLNATGQGVMKAYMKPKVQTLLAL